MEEHNYYKFIENTSAVNALKIDIKNKATMHAYMIVAFDDFTANLFANFFALHLICKNNNADLSCSSCVKALSGSNADLKTYPKNNKSIVVEDIEDIIETSLTKPIENENKVYLLKNFSSANIASQNKLLKILEEPPKNTYFILSVSNLDTVLQTISSRCKTIMVDNFENEEIFNILTQNNIDEQKAKTICDYCLNNLGIALSLAKLDNFEQILSAVEYLFANCNSTKDMLKTVSLIQPFSDDLNLFFNIVEIYLNKLVQYKANNNEVIEKFENIKNNFSFLAINATEKLIIDCKQKIQFNCSSMAIIDIFVLKFLEGKYKWN